MYLDPTHPDRAGELDACDALFGLVLTNPGDQRLQRALFAQLSHEPGPATTPHRLRAVRALADAPDLDPHIRAALSSHPDDRTRAVLVARPDTDLTTVSVADVHAETDRVLVALAKRWAALHPDTGAALLEHASGPTTPPDPRGVAQRLRLLEALLAHAGASGPLAGHADTLTAAYLRHHTFDSLEPGLRQHRHAATHVVDRVEAGFLARLHAARGCRASTSQLLTLAAAITAHPRPGAAAAALPARAEPDADAADYTADVLDALGACAQDYVGPCLVDETGAAAGLAAAWIRVAADLHHPGLPAADRAAAVLACRGCRPRPWVRAHSRTPQTAAADLDAALALGVDDPDLIASLYDHLDAADRARFAARILAEDHGAGELHTRVAAQAPDPVGAELLADLRSRGSLRRRFASWMVRWPAVVQLYVRDPDDPDVDADAGVLESAVRAGTPDQIAALADLLYADVGSHPDRWDTTTLGETLDRLPVRSEHLAGWPLHLVVGVLRHCQPRLRDGAAFAAALDDLVDAALADGHGNRLATWEALIGVPTVRVDDAVTIVGTLN